MKCSVMVILKILPVLFFEQIQTGDTYLVAVFGFDQKDLILKELC